MKKRTESQAKRYETTKPTAKHGTSSALSADRLLYSSYKDAAVNSGTAAKNEYSAAVFRSMPSIMPPRIVDDERDMPGHRARHWNRPTAKASRQRN